MDEHHRPLPTGIFCPLQPPLLQGSKHCQGFQHKPRRGTVSELSQAQPRTFHIRKYPRGACRWMSWPSAPRVHQELGVWNSTWIYLGKAAPRLKTKLKVWGTDQAQHKGHGEKHPEITSCGIPWESIPWGSLPSEVSVPWFIQLNPVKAEHQKTQGTNREGKPALSTPQSALWIFSRYFYARLISTMKV